MSAVNEIRAQVAAEAFVCRERHPLEWSSPTGRAGACPECAEIVQIVARAWESYRQVTAPTDPRIRPAEKRGWLK